MADCWRSGTIGAERRGSGLVRSGQAGRRPGRGPARTRSAAGERRRQLGVAPGERGPFRRRAGAPPGGGRTAALALVPSWIRAASSKLSAAAARSRAAVSSSRTASAPVPSSAAMTAAASRSLDCGPMIWRTPGRVKHAPPAGGKRSGEAPGLVPSAGWPVIGSLRAGSGMAVMRVGRPPARNSSPRVTWSSRPRRPGGVRSYNGCRRRPGRPPCRRRPAACPAGPAVTATTARPGPRRPGVPRACRCR